MSLTLVGNKIVDDHSYVVWAATVFIFDLTPDFGVVVKDNYKTRRETFKCWDLMLLIIEVWRHIWKAARLCVIWPTILNSYLRTDTKQSNHTWDPFY